MLDLFNGTSMIPFPFAHKSLKSAVSFFPIPYAKSCEVTLDHPPFYCAFAYRDYRVGTPIRTFTKADFAAARPLIERVGKALLNPVTTQQGKQAIIETKMEPEKEASVDLPTGTAAVRSLSRNAPVGILLGIRAWVRRWLERRRRSGIFSRRFHFFLLTQKPARR